MEISYVKFTADVSSGVHVKFHVFPVRRISDVAGLVNAGYKLKMADWLEPFIEITIELDTFTVQLVNEFSTSIYTAVLSVSTSKFIV